MENPRVSERLAKSIKWDGLPVRHCPVESLVEFSVWKVRRVERALHQKEDINLKWKYQIMPRLPDNHLKITFLWFYDHPFCRAETFMISLQSTLTFYKTSKTRFFKLPAARFANQIWNPKRLKTHNFLFITTFNTLQILK